MYNLEIMIMQFPQEFTFILTFSLGAIALILSYYNFRVNRARTSRSEQIKTSRDLWQLINDKYDPIIEITRNKGWPADKSGHIVVPWAMLSSLAREIDYFAYLVLIDEIKDKGVLNYYKKPLSDYIESILKYYTSPDERHDLYEGYYNFRELIKKWDINRPDEETNEQGTKNNK